MNTVMLLTIVLLYPNGHSVINRPMPDVDLATCQQVAKEFAQQYKIEPGATATGVVAACKEVNADDIDKPYNPNIPNVVPHFDIAPGGPYHHL